MTFAWRRWAQISDRLGDASQSAYAQRADENATSAAEDAFGTRVGNENVGLYSATPAETRSEPWLYKKRANLRLQVRNVANAYGWTVDGASGRIAPAPPRRYVVRLAADY